MKRRGNSFGSLRIDFLVFWMGLRHWLASQDWFDIGTRFTAWLCAFAVLSSLLAIAIAHGWLELPELAALRGLPN